ncbi:MAG: LamG domain-containing protein [Verrucomicrobia bacterium]|nr:LamG domain-containing protein [Verrucomicrobiota bacterium]
MPAMPRTVSTRIFPFLLAILATAPAIALELPSEETHAEVPAAPHSLVAQTFMSAVPPTFLSAGHSNGERASGLESPRYGRLESLRYAAKHAALHESLHSPLEFLPASTLQPLNASTTLRAASPSRDISALLLMPRVDDHTQMWWAEGFPSHTPAAPWLRVIQTGSYAFALNTETLRIPHFGAVSGGVNYDAAALQNGEAWRKLPPASLTLTVTVDGKAYHGTAGGRWSRHAGPRLIESGRFFQRADVTDLVFTADDRAPLNVEARLETAAWPDRLSLILAARPGWLPIPAGEAAFGRVGGGFGLDGTNHLEIPRGPELDSEQFTLELWAFVPVDYRASTTAFPWLVCKNAHEHADGHFGIALLDGAPQARINIGGGRNNAFAAEAASRQSLKINAWNHLAVAYDGDTLRLFVSGGVAGEKPIGRQRVPVAGAMAIGRRQDNSGDGYHFRGAVDEIRLYDRALTLDELRSRFAKPEAPRPALEPVAEWTFRADGQASLTRSTAPWTNAVMAIGLSTQKGKVHRQWALPTGQAWTASDWREVSLVLDPVTCKTLPSASPVNVAASEIPTGTARPVNYNPTLGWHRVNLDGLQPMAPAGGTEPSNDALERVKLVLSNPTNREEVARLMFEKTAGGIRQRLGSPITGVTAILRDAEGHPTGIPVQLSKNWHHHPEAGVYAGQWFHGISQVRLPPAASVELELTLAYGHWGGVAAASHAQLSLIGWGSNQLWNQTALGAWGESICFEPDQIQANCTITDVRPLMVRSMGKGEPWGWTINAGGGDFFRFFAPDGTRIAHTAMRTAFHRQGPCLTEVTFAGRIGESIAHAATVSLARSDDVTRGLYRLRLEVNQATDFSRFVIFQIGADTYSYTGERKMALGNETGLLEEWATQWGGNTPRTRPRECSGRVPWISLHEAVPREDSRGGAWANRGLVIRSWRARLGGQETLPWMVERGLTLHRTDSSALDLVPPPGIPRLEAGDFIEATIEHIVMPQFARDYYGPNSALRAALQQHENTWRMIHREAVGNDRRIELERGTLVRSYPAITVRTVSDTAEFTLTGGLGYVPIAFTGLTSPCGHVLFVDNRPVDQSIHGNDFWQTDYDPATQRWSQTYNVPVSDSQPRVLRLERQPSRRSAALTGIRCMLTAPRQIGCSSAGGRSPCSNER